MRSVICPILPVRIVRGLVVVGLLGRLEILGVNLCRLLVLHSCGKVLSIIIDITLVINLSRQICIQEAGHCQINITTMCTQYTVLYVLY